MDSKKSHKLAVSLLLLLSQEWKQGRFQLATLGGGWGTCYSFLKRKYLKIKMLIMVIYE